MTIGKTNHYLLSVLALLILLFFIFLSFSSRPAGDDLGMYNILKSHGFWGSVNYNYNFFNFRHLPILLFNLVFTIQNINQAYFLFLPILHLIILGFFIFGSAKAIQLFAKSTFQTNIQLTHCLIFSLLFLANLYFFTFQSIEIWTNFIIMVCYLYPVIASVFGFTLIYSNKSVNKTINYLLIIFCFAYAGGAAENYSLGLLLVMFTYIYSSFNQDKKNIKLFFSNSQNKKLILAFITLLISSAVVYLSPGTENRARVVKEFESLYQAPENASPLQAILHILSQNLFNKKTLIALAFFMLWMIIGAKLNTHNNSILLKKIKKYLAMLCFIFFGTTFYLSYSVFSGSIADRAWFPFNFISCILIIIFCVEYGSKKLKKINTNFLPLTISLILIIFTAFCWIQIPRMIHYANSYDQRIERLKQYSGTNSYVLVEPLLPSGIISSSEITNDTSNFSNKTFIEAYKINYNVALKSK